MQCEVFTEWSDRGRSMEKIATVSLNFSPLYPHVVPIGTKDGDT